MAFARDWIHGSISTHSAPARRRGWRPSPGGRGAPRLVATARNLYAIDVMSQSDEFQARLRTLEELRAAGIDPYPPRAHPTHTAAQVRALLQEREGDHVTVAGRIVGGLRPMGKLAFVHIQDGSGRIQLSIQRPVVGEEGWALLRRLHAGDIVEAAGETFHTQRGEPSVRVE